ncbi:MAG TPA: SpoIIE family protein phosphatase [Terracidiphilus sp.]|jgi:sigma-B regulation protein RsbU (phosphoserine phosphatase)|nr:SpoIIE family protein phosphatase [Terracidiphilus sp.]
MRKFPLILLLVMLGTNAGLRAQTFDLANGRVPLVSLNGLWRFHPGDDPRWADPKFDDSKWALLRSNEDWGVQGFPKLSGLAWYRFEVRVPPDLRQVSVLFPIIMTCYEVYGDGKLLGTVGRMPPNRMPYGGGKVEYFKLPAPQAGSDKVVVALRVWQWPGWAQYYGGGPFTDDGLVGNSIHIENEAGRAADRKFRYAMLDWLMCILEVLAGVGAFTLFLMRRTDREFLWLCLMLFSSAFAHWTNIWTSAFIVNIELRDLFNCVGTFVNCGATILFLLEVLRPKKTWLFRLALAAMTLALIEGVFESLSGSYLGVGTDAALLVACATVLSIWMISVAVSSGKRGTLDGRLLVIPVVLQTGVNILQGLAWSTFAFGWQNKFDGNVTLTNHPFPITLAVVVEAIFLIGLLGILILRFARKRSEEERIGAEVQAAQEVQQYFIPSQLPAIPGFKVESAYRPAREVGGDFFQVLPQANGSVLVVLGDVAGKGLQAGMLATLIVGAVRTAAKFTTDPKRMMELLNERLQGRGLVTCMAMLVEKDGAATLVNAGHLPPFLNGTELAMEGALPLGALAEIDFPVLRFKLAECDSLTLMSDGIVEAQDADGRLFGFDRIAEMLRRNVTASGLAGAAQDFGQEDDITVLTVARLTPVLAS